MISVGGGPPASPFPFHFGRERGHRPSVPPSASRRAGESPHRAESAMGHTVFLYTQTMVLVVAVLKSFKVLLGSVSQIFQEVR